MNAIEAVVPLPFDEGEAAIRAALADEGFGILTEIDVAATLKEKLGVDGPPLKILGACNPALAHRALELDPTVSLLLPCNVVVEPAGPGTRVAVVDPHQLMDDPRFDELADEAAARLSRAVAGLSPSVGE
jgi:uncharacterized protein (DUF302 family)